MPRLMKKEQSFQQTVLGKLNSYMQKKELNSYVTLHKENSKWIKDLTAKAKVIKHLQENRSNLSDFGFAESSHIL